MNGTTYTKIISMNEHICIKEMKSFNHCQSQSLLSSSHIANCASKFFQCYIVPPLDFMHTIKLIVNTYQSLHHHHIMLTNIHTQETLHLNHYNSYTQPSNSRLWWEKEKRDFSYYYENGSYKIQSHKKTARIRKILKVYNISHCYCFAIVMIIIHFSNQN